MTNEKKNLTMSDIGKKMNLGLVERDELNNTIKVLEKVRGIVSTRQRDIDKEYAKIEATVYSESVKATMKAEIKKGIEQDKERIQVVSLPFANALANVLTVLNIAKSTAKDEIKNKK